MSLKNQETSTGESTSLVRGVTETDSSIRRGAGADAITIPNRAKTLLILTLLTIPLFMGFKITLFSQDKDIRTHFINDNLIGGNVTDLAWGFTNALFPIGGCIGALSITPISDRIGRKFSVILCLCIGVFAETSVVISYFIKKYGFLILSRLLDGISAGSSMNVGICFFFELLPPQYAHICQPLVQLAICFGIVLNSALALESVMGSMWMIPALPALVLQAIMTLVLFLFPESPQYIYKKTKDQDKTLKTIVLLRGSNYAGSDAELKTIVDEETRNAALQSVTIMSFLSDKSLSMLILVNSVIQLAQQLSGVNVILYFAGSIIKDTGFSRPDIGSLAIISLTLIGSTVFAPFIAKFSSKLVLLIGYSIMSLSFFAAYIAMLSQAPGWLSLIFLGLFLFIFQLGPGPKPWVIIMEAFLPEQRIPAQGFFTFLNWGANALVAILYMWARIPLGSHVFVIFGIINMLTFLFLLKFMHSPMRNPALTS